MLTITINVVMQLLRNTGRKEQDMHDEVYPTVTSVTDNRSINGTEVPRLESNLHSHWRRRMSLRNSRRPYYGGVAIIGIRRA